MSSNVSTAVMGTATSHNPSTSGQISELIEAELLPLPSLIAEPLLGVLEPAFDNETADAPLSISQDTAESAAIDWDQLDQAVNLVNGHPNQVLIETDAIDNLIDDNAIQQPDQLTGFQITQEQMGEPVSVLLEQNLSPLIDNAFNSDLLLVAQPSDATHQVESLVDADSSTVGIAPSSALSAPPVIQLNQELTLFEDQPFSIPLSDLFPQQIDFVSLQVSSPKNNDTDWIGLEQRQPDSTLVERLIIETQFSNERGEILNTEEIASLPSGSTLQADLLVTDSRADGLGLIGLSLDLSWIGQAAELTDITFAETLPLFQNSGDLDPTSGTLVGLTAASLPSSGTGDVLGDTIQDLFATLSFQTTDAIQSGLNLNIQPVLLPTSKNQSLSSDRVLSIVGSEKPIPVIYGIADQTLVGNQTLLVEYVDSLGNLWQNNLSLKIENVNDAPLALPIQPISVLEDSPFSLDLYSVFSDSDLAYGDQLVFRLLDPSSTSNWLTLDHSTGLLTGQPDQPQVGHWQLEIEAEDLSGATAVQQVTLTIENVNDPPYWSTDELPDLLIRENQAFSIQLPVEHFLDQDADGPLEFSLVSGITEESETWFNIDSSSGLLYGIAPSATIDAINLSLKATDIHGLSSSTPLTLQVVDKLFNRPPYIVGEPPANHVLNEGDTVRYDLAALFRDDDSAFGDKLHYEADIPEWMSFSPDTGLLTGISDNNTVGTHQIHLKATDDYGASAAISMELVVNNINQAPELLVPSTEARLLNTGNRFQLNLSDIFKDLDVQHGDHLSYSLLVDSTSSAGLPNWLSWDSSLGELNLSPGADDRGLLRLQFIATDSQGKSANYALNLGIVSETGIVEVNQSLQKLHLLQGEVSTLDLQDAFAQLRNGSQIDYSFELLQRGSDGILQKVSSNESDWITLIDRASVIPERSGRITIEPILRLTSTGEIVDTDQLTTLEQGTELQLSINVSDLREATDITGLIGLDLDLSWTGLSLSSDNSIDINNSITDLLPLFRSVDTSLLEQNTLRLTGASLPSFGIGDILGDQPDETFFQYNFILNNPLEPVQIELDLIDERNGGLGYGLADGSSPDRLLDILDLSTVPLHEIRIDTSGQNEGVYALKVSASASEDQVSQIVPLIIGSGVNTAPSLNSTISKLSPYDNWLHTLDLGLLFTDYDLDNLTFKTSVTSDNPDHAALISKALNVAYRQGIAQLEIDVPGLESPVNGSVTVEATDGALSASQTMQILLNPRSEAIPVFANPSLPTFYAGQIVGLGDILSEASIEFRDEYDDVLLVLRSEDPLDLRFSNEFIFKADLTYSQAQYLEKSLLSSISQSEESLAIVPISKLTQLVSDTNTSFDLNWLELKAPKQHQKSLALQLSTLSHVAGDTDGSLYGISTSEATQALLITTPATEPKILTSASQRHLASLLAAKGIEIPVPTDGIGSATTNKSTLVAWKNQESFESSISGEINDISSIVRLTVNSDVPPSSSDSGVDPLATNYELRNVSVRSASDSFFAGAALDAGLDEQTEIVDFWDPLSFTLVKSDDSDSITDSDPDRDGVQVEVEINMLGSQLQEGDLNAYRKFVAAETLQAASDQGLILRDLDGNTITNAGWYDFTQRVDSQGQPIGDGARFVVVDSDGKKLISKIVLTLTDNSFGDNNLNFGVIDDPGMPVKLVSNPLDLSPLQLGISKPLTNTVFPNQTLTNPSVDSLSETVETLPEPVEDPSAQVPPVDPVTSSKRAKLDLPQPSNSSTSSSLSSQTSSSPAPSPLSVASTDLSFRSLNPAEKATNKDFSSSSNYSSKPSSAGLTEDTLQIAQADNPVNTSNTTSQQIRRSLPSSPFPTRWDRSHHQSSTSYNDTLASITESIYAFFNRLMDSGNSSSSLAGLMLGMALTPNLVDRSLQSLFKTDLGRSIKLQRRNADLQADWNILLNSPAGPKAIHLCLNNGQLSILPSIQSGLSSESSNSSLSSSSSVNPSGILSRLLLCHPKAGELMEQVRVHVDSLLNQPLDYSHSSWIEWLDSHFSQCKDYADSELSNTIRSFRADLVSAYGIDPSLADALMMIELLDCDAKVGGRTPTVT